MSNIFGFLILSLTACGSSDDSGKDTTNISSNGCHMVTTTDESSDMEVYMDFSPEDLTISVGDCVQFVMSDTHNAIEVSEENYTNRDSTALDGGFQVQYGETVEVTFDEAGTHYYVCQPHITMDMIGTITVE